jgi:hypothetical protein
VRRSLCAAAHRGIKRVDAHNATRAVPRQRKPDALTVVPVAGVLAAACFPRAARTYERDRVTGDWHQLPDISRRQDGGEAFR